MRRFLKLRWVVTLILGVSLIGLWGFASGDSRSFQMAKNLDIFNSIVKELDLFYVDTIDPNKTVREGIDAMLYSLDPYTEYYPEDDQDELEQMLKNSYGGIGSVITYSRKTQYTTISEPYEGMPAAEAGLKAGDILLELDGQDLKGNPDVSTLLRGQVGTSFKLKVQRPGVKKPLEFDIVRRSIELPIIPYYGMVGDSIGYINLSTFSGNPSQEFKEAFLSLKREAVDIANFFLPRGETLVTTKGRLKQADNVYKTLREPIDPDIPLAVLVNSATASASEILAGSLQDLDRAVLVGTRTFGKGLVQTTRPLPYGGMMKLTTSKYYIPSGRCVQAIDYAHRNADGSVGRIPDSLTTEFRTRAGRIVRDGGGVTPDIEVETEKLPNILFYLVNENLIFDYATDYCLKHDRVASPEQFEVTDADYAAFKKKVKAADFKYDQQTEKMLKSLKEMAEFEGYLDDASAEFDALEKKLRHNLDRDLDHFAKEIKDMLAVEIIKRYYYQRGSIIQQLKDDPDLKEAVKILGDPVAYQKMLSAPAADEQRTDSL